MKDYYIKIHGKWIKVTKEQHDNYNPKIGIPEGFEIVDGMLWEKVDLK